MHILTGINRVKAGQKHADINLGKTLENLSCVHMILNVKTGLSKQEYM